MTCAFTLDELPQEYPQEIVPPGMTLTGYLRSETYDGARRRYGTTIPETAQALIEKELNLIAELKYDAYFLTVYDVVKFARSQVTLCQAEDRQLTPSRCYRLHITEVDPNRMSMLFERFISKERNEPPDIDVDFEHQRREEVIQYIYRKSGRDRAALCATVSSYRSKGALRDVGKVLGLGEDQIDRIAKNMAWWRRATDIGRSQRFRRSAMTRRHQISEGFIKYALGELIGFP